MNNLQVIGDFEILDSKTLTIYGNIENPLFFAKEVAEWIDYSKTSQGYYDVSTMLKSVDEHEKLKLTSTNNLRSSWFLTENGLYEVLMQSRKPIAKQFKTKIKALLQDLRKGEIKLVKGDDSMSNELATNDIQTLIKSMIESNKIMVESMIESNNQNTACMQQVTNMVTMCMQMMSGNFQSNNTNSKQQNSNDNYIASLVKCAVGKYYNMSDISKLIQRDLKIVCDARRLNSYLVDKGVLHKVTGFVHEGNIYSKFYIFTEDYRDKYNTILVPGRKEDDVYLNTLYDGKCQMFIYNYIKDNREDFINF